MITLYEDAPYGNIVRLVERCAPRLMAGGYYPELSRSIPNKVVTQEQKARVLEMAKAGETFRAIAKATGTSESYAWKVAHRTPNTKDEPRPRKI